MTPAVARPWAVTAGAIHLSDRPWLDVAGLTPEQAADADRSNACSTAAALDHLTRATARELADLVECLADSITVAMAGMAGPF